MVIDGTRLWLTLFSRLCNLFNQIESRVKARFHEVSSCRKCYPGSRFRVNVLFEKQDVQSITALISSEPSTTFLRSQ